MVNDLQDDLYIVIDIFAKLVRDNKTNKKKG